MSRGYQVSIALIGFLLLASICTVDALKWIGKSSPGFMVYPNLVVASNRFPTWKGIDERIDYPAKVVTLEGIDIENGKEFYRRIETTDRASLGVTLQMGVRSYTRELPRFIIQWADLFWLYGVPLFIACIFFVYGIIVWSAISESVAARALVVFCMTSALSLLLLFDSFTTYRFYRLYLAVVSLLPSSIIYMSLYFPSRRQLVDRFPSAQGYFFLFALFIGVLLQVFLYRVRDVWVFVDQFNRGLIIFAASAFVLTSAISYRESYVLIEKLRAKIVLAATVLIVALPVLMRTYCWLFKISIPPNLYLLPWVIFPFAIAYAMVRHDLFQVRLFLKRGVLSALWSYVLSALYTAGVVFGARALGLGGEFMRSPYAPALIFVGMLVFTTVFFDGVKTFANKLAVDREQAYQKTIAEVGESLVQVFDAGHVVRRLERGIQRAMGVEKVAFFQWNEKSQSYLLWPGGWKNPELAKEVLKDHPLVQVLDKKKTGIMAFEIERDPGYHGIREGVLKELTRLGVEFVVPVRYGDPFQLVGFILLGRKKNQELYGTEDLELLQTLSRNVAIALANAGNMEKLEEKTRQLIRAQKMAAIGTVAAKVAHDLRNPYASFSSGHLLLKEWIPKLKPFLKEGGEVAFKEIEEVLRLFGPPLQMMSDVVGGLHSLSRSSDRMEPVDVVKGLEIVLAMLQPQWREKIEVEKEYQPVPFIWGKSGELNGVWMNLLVNAAQALGVEEGREGKIWIHVRQEEEKLLVKIRDTGCGISHEHLSKIFDPHFTTKGEGEGSGLGLNICKETIERHGGSVAVKSEIGKGTEFTVTLPVRLKSKEEM